MLPTLLHGVLLLSLLPMTSQEAAVSDGEARGYARPELLVSTARLAEIAAQVAVLDVRSPEEYAAGHVPGSVNLPLARTFDPQRPGDVASPELLARALGECGVSRDARVVVLDGGRSPMAPRAFWTLELLGHPHVALLDGGLARWVHEGRPLSQEAPAVEPVEYVLAEAAPVLSTADSIEAELEAGACASVDARSDQEYAAGHLPGTVHVEWTRNFTEEEAPVFLAPERLRALYADVLARPSGTVHAYCRSGQRAAVAYFALRLLGEDGVTNYDGSWRDWATDPERPIER